MNRYGTRHILRASVAALAIGITASVAHAQETLPDTQEPPAVAAVEEPVSEAADAPEGEIVVTANRRSMLLSETPAALSVVSGETLRQAGVADISDLTGRLPNVTIGTAFGSARIAIRGIGFNPVRPGDEGRVAYYVDQIYTARPEAQLGSLFDVDRIEVLRGPQGTLYGRNATGGAVLVITRDPTTTPSGYLNATIGNYDLRQFSGALSGPISDTLSARVAFETVDRSGYNFNASTGNRINDRNTQAIRATLLWRPSSQFSLRVSADAFREDSSSGQWVALRPSGLLPPTAPTTPIIYGGRTVSIPRDPILETDTYGVSAIATYAPSDYLTLTVVGGARHLTSLNAIEGANCLLNDCARSYSQNDADQYNLEVQLAGEGERFDWIVGGTYFRENQSPIFRSAINGRFFGNPAAPFLTQGTRSSADLTTDAKSVFADGTFEIVDSLFLTVGVRYSWETKQALNNFSSLDRSTPWPNPNSPDFGFVLSPPSAGFPRDEEVNFDAWTPRFAVRYEVTRDFNIYANFTQGFKSGGFNYGTNQAPYLPETIDSYELGFSLGAFQRQLTLRGAVFRYEYQGLQQTVLQLTTPGTFVLNTGDARIQGVELEFVARPTRAFQIDGNFAILDSRFGTYLTRDPNTMVTLDIEGNRVPQAPSYTMSIGAQYEFETDIGDLTLRANYRRQGKTYFEIFNQETAAQTAYGVFDLNLGWDSRDGHWNGSLFARNIGNTFAANQSIILSNSLQAVVAGALIPPRTYGVQVGYRF